jgi:glycosidase
VDSGIETLFDFPMHYALLDVFARGRSMKRLTDTLAADTLYENPMGLVPFLGLHDTTRFLSEPGATPAGMKLAFTYLFTTRGTPLLYYGDEIALRGGKDPYNRAPFPGGWPDDPQNAFSVEGRTPEQQAMHSHVRQLLALRRELAPLRRGKLIPLHTEHTTHAFARTHDNETVVVALNNAPRSQLLEIPLAPIALPGVEAWTDRLGRLGTVTATNHHLHLGLPPHSAAILTPRRAVPLSGVVSGDEATEH